ncbi:MAG: hypothetical protein KKH52_00545 [Nanoarchaeota archaeon]|nr:hypothetical protein [Nanoarchaeota archaeon]MBU1622364.1 hypothetical protein [Nanoarchaeota archaeon]MBU1973864.1 hypothetical protein [Nanoarchaeota archaeon]
MIEALEQMLEMVPSVGTTQDNYATIDVFTSGYSQMDCGKCGHPCIHDGFIDGQMRNDFSPFLETNTGIGVTIPPISGISDYHETFKTDRYDNLYGGHSSITISGKKKSIFHDD